MKHKVGDKVKIRRDLQVGKYIMVLQLLKKWSSLQGKLQQ